MLPSDRMSDANYWASKRTCEIMYFAMEGTEDELVCLGGIEYIEASPVDLITRRR